MKFAIAYKSLILLRLYSRTVRDLAVHCNNRIARLANAVVARLQTVVDYGTHATFG